MVLFKRYHSDEKNMVIVIDGISSQIEFDFPWSMFPVYQVFFFHLNKIHLSIIPYISSNEIRIIKLNWPSHLQTSHEDHGIQNHCQLDCWFNNLFKLTSNKTRKLHVNVHLLGEQLVTGGFPTQRASNAESISMSWHHHADHVYELDWHFMMTSSNGNIFRVTGHLCGEFSGPRWIPHTKASDAELWCFLRSASE